MTQTPRDKAHSSPSFRRVLGYHALWFGIAIAAMAPGGYWMGQSRARLDDLHDTLSPFRQAPASTASLSELPLPRDVEDLVFPLGAHHPPPDSVIAAGSRIWIGRTSVRGMEPPGELLNDVAKSWEFNQMVVLRFPDRILASNAARTVFLMAEVLASDELRVICRLMAPGGIDPDIYSVFSGAGLPAPPPEAALVNYPDSDGTPVLAFSTAGKPDAAAEQYGLLLERTGWRRGPDLASIEDSPNANRQSLYTLDGRWLSLRSDALDGTGLSTVALVMF